jgi:hypothetical protein
MKTQYNINNNNYNKTNSKKRLKKVATKIIYSTKLKSNNLQNKYNRVLLYANNLNQQLKP